MCNSSRIRIIRSQRLCDRQLSKTHCSSRQLTKACPDELRRLRYISLVQKNINGTTIDCLHNRRIVSPLQNDTHKILLEVIRRLLILVADIALFAEDNKRPEDLVILKVMRRLQTRRHKLTTFLCEFNGPDKCLTAHKSSPIRSPWIETHKE